MSARAKSTRFTREERRKIKELAAKLVQIRAAIAADRDKLREVLDEYEEILDCCNRAEEGIDQAADALSEYL